MSLGVSASKVSGLRFGTVPVFIGGGYIDGSIGLLWS